MICDLFRILLRAGCISLSFNSVFQFYLFIPLIYCSIFALTQGKKLEGPDVTKNKHRILSKDLIRSIFLKCKQQKAKLIKKWKEYVLFYPIFRKAITFFIRVLQIVAFGNWFVTRERMQIVCAVSTILR